jgi:hypothetical protein
MNSPFEELEYLADYLPDEGESVIVTRQFGELTCETLQREQQQTKELTDSDFYGRLVQANERLAGLGTLPLWSCALVFFWSCVLLHQLAGLGWNGWYLDVGIGLTTLMTCFVWIRMRQNHLFSTEFQAMLNWQLRRRKIDKYSLIGQLRQRNELRTLLDTMNRVEH